MTETKPPPRRPGPRPRHTWPDVLAIYARADAAGVYVRQADIARDLGYSRTRINQFVDELLDLGYLHERDPLVGIYEITDAGRAAVEAGEEA